MTLSRDGTVTSEIEGEQKYTHKIKEAEAARIFALSQKVVSEIQEGVYYFLHHEECQLDVSRGSRTYVFSLVHSRKDGPDCPEQLRELLREMSGLTKW